MQPASGASSPKPLFFMEKLGRLVSLYRPTKADASISNSANKHPQLIIVSSWTDARDVHIDKYIVKYQTLYPGAPILLLKNTTAEIYRPSRIGPAMKAAVPVVRDVHPPRTLPSSPEVLIHIFSNGGSGSIANLYEQFAASAGPGEQFPRHVTILDSSPSVYSVGHALTFVSLSMSPFQRIVATPFLYIWAIGWSVLVALGLVTTSGDWAKAHNNKPVETEARRVYIYSGTDVLIDDKGVESHAADAEAKGFSVKLERFEGSAHVAHSRKDEDRYWDIVKKTWGGVP
uniref:Indole-diterpene biosynthesis protein PaxU n=1 Tax=Bionectria ochroleuca TaxID=29856 RepID=A0A8H7KA02_BIOOC